MMKPIKLITPVLLFTLSGCGWVDSTGRQGSADTVVVDPTIILLDSSDSFPVEENTQRNIAFSGPNNRVSNWSWNLLEGQANIDQCQGVDGFDRTIASNSLSQSCADGNRCEIRVEEIMIDSVTQFRVTTPELRSPAALEYQFTAQTDAGVLVEQRQTLCAIAINNPPEAMDDLVSLMRGTRLEVSGDSMDSLLFNDSDDNDVRNQTLRIDPTPVIPPRFADNFELFQDGGFIYEPAINAPVSVNGSVSDTFTYLVSDGNETSTATVNIQISDFNSAPVQDDAIDDISINLDDENKDLEIAFLQSYFSDDENDLLEFVVLDDSLPASGNLYLTSDGTLEGFASEEDSGLYFVTIGVSDGIERIEASFFLTIVSDRARNRRPTADDITNTTVTGEFSYDVSVFFNDADDDHLFFSAINLPPGVEITSDGVIFGTAGEENEGNWLIRVKAEDGNGGSTDDGFRLRIR